ncbi:hypothetical protein OF83DRAFT_929617 [Amylostereum chailletii]|nr:hypothetical protein OF83DRAFT_929617 [Amylostereum chailletii]
MPALRSNLYPDDEPDLEYSAESMLDANQKSRVKVERWLKTLPPVDPKCSGVPAFPKIQPNTSFGSFCLPIPPTSGKNIHDAPRPKVTTYSTQSGCNPPQPGRRPTAVPPIGQIQHGNADRPAMVVKSKLSIPGAWPESRPSLLPTPASAHGPTRARGGVISTASAAAGYAGGQLGAGREKTVYVYRPGARVGGRRVDATTLGAGSYNWQGSQQV